MPVPGAVLMYGSRWERSATRLARALGIDRVYDSDNGERNPVLIRYGNAQRVAFRSEKVINSRQAILNASDKYLANLELIDQGIDCPPVSTDFSLMAEEFGFPLLGRPRIHFGGQSVVLYMQRSDLATYGGSQYYMPYYPKTHEWRVYVGRVSTIDPMDIWQGLRNAGLLNHNAFVANHMRQTGVTLKVSEKVRLREPRDWHQEQRNIIQDIIWNWDAGFSYRNAGDSPYDTACLLAIQSVLALGLDFGAVDVMRTEGGEYYVMEVNTAPALESDHSLSVLSSYIRSRITGQVNVQESEVINAVL